MRRRALLRTSAGATISALPLTQSVSASAAVRRDGYAPLGRVSVDDAAEAVVGDDGETAYLAVTDGFAAVDISNPTNPTILASERGLEVDGRRLTAALDVKTDGDRLVIAGPVDTAPKDVFHGFIVYDVSDPSNPVQAAKPYETGYHIHNCYLEGKLLFVVANDHEKNPLVIFDVSDGVEEIGRWSLLEHEPGWRDVHWRARYSHDVYVQDGIAYLAHWNAGTYLLDVSDPADPTFLSRVIDTSLEKQRTLEDYMEARVGLPGNDHYAAVDDTGDLLAVGREAWATGGDKPDHPGGIDLYDVSEPSEPTSLATITAPAAANERYDGGLWTTSHNFELRNGRLYSSWYQGGVKIHDISDPAAPEELAQWRDPTAAGFWTARVAKPGETFIASSTPLIPNTDIAGALYTFPIEAGEQVDPPSLTDPATLEDAADNGTDNTTKHGFADNRTDNHGSGGSDSIPGFSALGTAASLAGSALTLEWIRRQRGDQ